MCFFTWQRSLTRGMFIVPCWVEMLLHVATKQVEVQETIAAIAPVIKCTSSLTEGPRNSLKTLHRFSRVAT